MKTKTIKLGEVGVDSGQLIVCDPCYIESEFIPQQESEYSDHAHTIYRHVGDNTMWQFTYGSKAAYENVHPFPGSYHDIIHQYDKSPNDLIAAGIFVKTDLDPTPHVPLGVFSYASICKVTGTEGKGGQIKYALGHDGVAVAFETGFGDGVYDVKAEIVETESGTYIKRIIIDFFDECDLE